MRFKKKQQGIYGYTIVELMVTIAILACLITMIFSIFVSKMNICSSLDRGVELQQQGLFILSFIEERIVESEGIEYIEDIKGHMKLHSNEPVRVKKIIFRNKETSEDNDAKKVKGYIFNLTYKMESNYYNLLYGTGLTGTGTAEVGNYIESIELEPIPIDKPFIDANGIKIKISLIYDGNRDYVENIFCFRNKPGRY